MQGWFAPVNSHTLISVSSAAIKSVSLMACWYWSIPLKEQENKGRLMESPYFMDVKKKNKQGWGCESGECN